MLKHQKQCGIFTLGWLFHWSRLKKYDNIRLFVPCDTDVYIAPGASLGGADSRNTRTVITALPCIISSVQSMQTIGDRLSQFRLKAKSCLFWRIQNDQKNSSPPKESFSPRPSQDVVVVPPPSKDDSFSLEESTSSLDRAKSQDK